LIIYFQGLIILKDDLMGQLQKQLLDDEGTGASLLQGKAEGAGLV